MPRRPPPQLEALGRQMLVGLGRIGGRAVAAGVKSVMGDGKRIAKQAEERFDASIRRVNEFLGNVEDED